MNNFIRVYLRLTLGSILLTTKIILIEGHIDSSQLRSLFWYWIKIRDKISHKQ